MHLSVKTKVKTVNSDYSFKGNVDKIETFYMLINYALTANNAPSILKFIAEFMIFYLYCFPVW